MRRRKCNILARSFSTRPWPFSNRAGGVVPIFCDKHLSYRWDWAKEMVDTARQMNIPLMAGSSVPLAERRPPLELPAGAKIVEAVSIHGGGLEGYDFHALEVLQSMVEARSGGESGVRQVQFLEGEPLCAAEAGQWSADLAADAMAAEVGQDHELTRLLRSRGKTAPSEPVPIHALIVHYRDGLRGVAMKVGNNGIRWNFACRLAGESTPRATAFYVGPWQNRNLFKALSHAIQAHFRQRKRAYPVERTLLTSGILDAAMDSRLADGKTVDTPQLDVAYAAQDFAPCEKWGRPGNSSTTRPANRTESSRWLFPDAIPRTLRPDRFEGQSRVATTSFSSRTVV